MRATVEDKPMKADPIAALDVGTSGVGWALGGWSGQADDAGRGTDCQRRLRPDGPRKCPDRRRL